MRSKKTLINTVMELLLQLVTVICGFILPRLILEKFGSQYNGVINSITQFLACAVLLRSGIGGATRAALYKPLANKDRDEINSIMKATDLFMKKIGLILGGLIFVAAIVYPFLVQEEFDWFFTFSLFLIIGISTFAESFWGITYLILLQADQKLWISSVIKIFTTILNVVIASILILNDFSIHLVKLGSAIAFCIYPIFLNIKKKKKYQLNLNVQPNNNAISQRWDAFWHQVSTFVTNNTDIIVLTVFSNMLEVSVYSVYKMVVSALKNIVFTFSNGLEAAFGNMIAKREKEALKENLSIVEFVVYNLSTIVYSCSIVLILQFVSVYTKGINDVNYIRPTFAYILLIANFFYSIRIPYQLVIQAAGHYKQTRNGAILEAVINIVISIIFVIYFGLIGVAIGTFVSMAFRTIQLSVYMCKNIVKRSNFITIGKCLISFAEIGIIILLFNLLNLQDPNNYVEWIKNAMIVGIISLIIVLIGILIFYRKNLKEFLLKINNALHTKNKKERGELIK